MNKRQLSIAFLFGFAGLATTACSMFGQGKQDITEAAVMVPLTAKSEVPPNDSTGPGTARVVLDGNVLKWTVTYSGLTGPVTAGHFHGPAQPGVNAGVVVPFNGPLTSPFIGFRALTAAQVDEVKAGLWYINLHTTAHPNGEVRGQVK